MIFSLLLNKNIRCGCFLEASQRDASDKHPQCIFLWRTKEDSGLDTQSYPLSRALTNWCLMLQKDWRVLIFIFLKFYCDWFNGNYNRTNEWQLYSDHFDARFENCLITFFVWLYSLLEETGTILYIFSYCVKRKALFSVKKWILLLIEIVSVDYICVMGGIN